MRWSVLVLYVVGCGGGSTKADCKRLLDDPAYAMEVTTRLYPGQPAKVGEVFERCVAPGGDECERIAKILAAISNMAVEPKLPAGTDILTICRGLTPERRRCMLPSYTVAHREECAKVFEPITTMVQAQGSATSGDTPKRPPVLIVSRTELVFEGKHVASVAALATGSGTIAALIAELPPKPADPTLILQVHPDTTMEVLTRIIETARAAGYDDVRFGVRYE